MVDEQGRGTVWDPHVPVFQKVDMDILHRKRPKDFTEIGYDMLHLRFVNDESLPDNVRLDYIRQADELHFKEVTEVVMKFLGRVYGENTTEVTKSKRKWSTIRKCLKAIILIQKLKIPAGLPPHGDQAVA